MSSTLLQCAGLTKTFGGLVALDRFDVEIGRGETIGLVGPNGSGKTTFFNVITGLYDPSGDRSGLMATTSLAVRRR